MKPDKFITFLRESGAEILDTTNQYEVVRFRTINGVSVMYTGRRGYSFTGDAQEAYNKFKNKSIWRIRTNSQKLKDQTLCELLERDDGDNCFFCDKRTYPGENQTIEHFLPVADGGNNNLKNLCIACSDCNKAVADMAIVDKIKYLVSINREALK